MYWLLTGATKSMGHWTTWASKSTPDSWEPMIFFRAASVACQKDLYQKWLEIKTMVTTSSPFRQTEQLNTDDGIKHLDTVLQPWQNKYVGKWSLSHPTEAPGLWMKRDVLYRVAVEPSSLLDKNRTLAEPLVLLIHPKNVANLLSGTSCA